MTPLPAADTYASSLPSRESLGQQYAAEVICWISVGVGFSSLFHNRRAATPMAKSTPAAVSMPMGIGNLWALAMVGSVSVVELRSDLRPGSPFGVGPATGAMKRYPRRGTVSTYLG